MADPIPHDAVVPTSLEINPTSAADAIVLALSGELDIASAPTFERALDEFDASQPRRLVIDLRDVTFMDSTGLRTLLLARQRAEDGNYELLLRPGPRQVQRVFELSGTLARFSFENPPAGV